MGGELVWVHVGQCGIQVAVDLWTLFREDHELDAGISFKQSCSAAFRELKTGSVVPRNLCIDTDLAPVCDFMKNTKVIPSDTNVATDVESSGNLYPRGKMSKVAVPAMDRMRLLMEDCERPGGFVFVYGSGGGTGSGLAAQVSGSVFCESPKLNQVHFNLTPSPGLRALPTATVEAYNAGLMANEMSRLRSCCVLLDNDALYCVSGVKGRFNKPDYGFINKIVAMALLVTTSGWRFNSSPSIKFDDLPTNLVITPDMKYSAMSLAPICNCNCLPYENLTTGDVTRELFQTNSYLVRCDPRAPAMAACIAYRGDVSPVSISEALCGLVDTGGAKFVSWTKPSFKVGITEKPLPSLFGLKLSRSACMLSNSRALAPSWGQIDWVFDKMYHKKAFLHWYMKEGMDYADFEDSLQTLKDILHRYSKD